jgi:serine/threonine protein kinase
MYPQIFGKYVLEKELAMGGMARVLLATLRGAGGFEKRLVVKQIRDELAVDHEFVQRFVEEAKTTVALSHPNIVPVYELGIEMGTYYLAMELVDGVSVDVLLGKNAAGERQKLSPEEGAYIGVEMCRALDYAHRRMQVVHRDITPRNVMVDEEGQVKLIDFGIAARASVAGQDVFGTPGHMPPEQMNRQEVGPATDIFAVAVLLMELWGGVAPFRRKTPAECMVQMNLPHPKPSSIDPRLLPLDAIIGSAMALDKAERPKTADDLGRVLRKFLQDTDLGDVARKLGARVREARALAARSKKRRAADGSLIKPSKPSMPDMGPRTFAARVEVEVWGAETRSDRPKEMAGDEPMGTRRLPSSERPPELDAPKVETVATRPLETPIDTPHASARARTRRIGIALGVALATPLIYWAAVRATAVPAGGGLASTSTGSSPLPTHPPAVGADAADIGSVSPPVSPPQGATSDAGTTPPPSSAPTAPPSTAPTASTGTHAAGGQLVLVGDFGTQFAIDDAAFRPCPASIWVKPGPHRVKFLFSETQETAGERIDVAAGEHITLRADFAGAAPRIRIEH